MFPVASALQCFYGLGLLTLAAASVTGQQIPRPIGVEKIELLGIAEVSGLATDRSGLPQALGGGSYNNLLGGFSAMDYSKEDDCYFVLPDRGPQDGAVDWNCRVQQFSFSIEPTTSPVVTPQLLRTILLTDESGRPFLGSAASLEASHDRAARLDPEGIRVGTNGNLFISDEYGPYLLEFQSDGRLVRRIPVPEHYLIANPCPISDDENGVNQQGRQGNRGLEGLAISPDRQLLWGLMQSPLLQDSDRTENPNKPKGLNCRLLQLSIDGTHLSERLYQLDQAENKLNELLQFDTDQFVCIERDGEAGTAANFKKLMLINTDQATNIAALDRLPPYELPPQVRAVSKCCLIDLLDPQWKLAGETMPEKIEALTWGPDLADGRRTLLVGSDNDFITTNSSYFYVFAIPQKLLVAGPIKLAESISND